MTGVDVRTSACVESAWAKALYEALLQVADQPIYDSVVADVGRPVLAVRGAA